MPSVTTYLAIEKWDEDRTIQTTPRVTPAHVIYKIPDLEGSIDSNYLMTYTKGGNASFIFTDTVKSDNFSGKKGSFIAQGKGSFDASSYTVMGSFNIVEGSGVDGMAGVKGFGSFESAPSKEQPTRVRWTCMMEDS